MPQKILAVDDEKDILTLLAHCLKGAGYAVLTAQGGEAAVKAALKEQPDLIILDVMLPDMDGTEVLRALKKNALTSRIPVVMLTAKGEEIDRVVGFELGADDYMVKPFSPKELVLRVRAILAKLSPVPASRTVESGPLTIDLERFIVAAGEKEVPLTTTEFRILSELVSSRGRVLSRETILRRASTIEGHETHRSVDTHVRRIRAKLGEHGQLIETVRGIGYRFSL